MRVYRGRVESIEADRNATTRLLAAAETGTRAVRVFCPHRQVAFGRRDANRTGYERARTLARERGFEPVERHVGGSAVAYDGETTLAFVRAEPIADPRTGIEIRYDRLLDDVADALSALGIQAERGEPPAAFCPGSHSLSVRVHASESRSPSPSVSSPTQAGESSATRGGRVIWNENENGGGNSNENGGGNSNENEGRNETPSGTPKTAATAKTDADPASIPDAHWTDTTATVSTDEIPGHLGRRKIVGVAQRVTKRAALVSGILVVDRAHTLSSVLSPVYDSLGIPFDPRTVGDLTTAGSGEKRREPDVDRVRKTLERHLVGDDASSVEYVDE